MLITHTACLWIRLFLTLGQSSPHLNYYVCSIIDKDYRLRARSNAPRICSKRLLTATVSTTYMLLSQG